jgi:hypothetical protein
MPEKAKCRSCGADILWLHSAATRTLMPLNAEPAKNGNVFIVDGLAHVKRAGMFEADVVGPLYLNHFVTCPSREEHRKAKAK